MLLNTMDFRTNYADIISQPGGGYRIVQKDRPLHRISCPSSSRDRWLSYEDRHGLWSRSVLFAISASPLYISSHHTLDLHIGWEDSWLQCLECEMKPYRGILGLDLTFRVLRHIVCDTITKLQQPNLLCRCICPSDTMISCG